MNIENLKVKLTEIMNNQNGKIILAKKISKRNEFVFSIGKTNYEPSETLFENEEYILFSEGVSESLINEVKESILI